MATRKKAPGPESPVLTPPDVPQLVDELGTTKAEIAKLEERCSVIVTTFKGFGVGRIKGSLFEVNNFEQERELTDYKAVCAELMDQMIKEGITTHQKLKNLRDRHTTRQKLLISKCGPRTSNPPTINLEAMLRK